MPAEGVVVSPRTKKILVFVIWTLPIAFLENLLFGWAQMELGITNEHVEQAVRLAIQLGIPALTVAVGFYLYYKVIERFGPKQPERTDDHHPRADQSDVEIKHLSNPDLRQRATKLAAEMRVFEANFRATESVRMHEQWSRSAMRSKDTTEERKSAAWHQDRLTDSQYRARFQAEFMTRYYPKAVALRHELAGRLGIFPPYREMSVALDHGMLAGVNPVTEAADLLDSLASKLP